MQVNLEGSRRTVEIRRLIASGQLQIMGKLEKAKIQTRAFWKFKIPI
jgi:hypothetical protein